MSDYITRFTTKQRVEHFLTMIVFTVLCLTGLPQKFYEAAWAQRIVDVFGGIDSARWIHRFCGWTLLISTVYHFYSALWAIGTCGVSEPSVSQLPAMFMARNSG